MSGILEGLRVVDCSWGTAGPQATGLLADYGADGRVAEVADPERGDVRQLAVLVRVSDADVPPHRLAPELGEHSDEILTWLGYKPDEIPDLRDRGAVR